MASLKDQFLLRPDIHFLNFGSFGATPKPIFEKYQDWQRVLEAEPVQFIAFDGYEYLAEARAVLARFLNCADKDDLVYVTNPSFAVNMIAKSFPLAAGDEILATDIEYGACDRTWDYYCTKKGATYRRQKINLPIVSKEQFIEDFFKGCNEKTKAIFISHITSATGLIFPAAEICAIAKEKGLITIVDGAHAFAHFQYSIDDLGCDYYAASLHKWLSSPLGAGILYINKNRIKNLWPLLADGEKQLDKIKRLNHIGTHPVATDLTINDSIDYYEMIGAEKTIL